MAEPSLSHRLPAFAMTLLAGRDSLALEALRDGAIKPGDMATLWAVMQTLNWRSGRCWASTAELAAATGRTIKQVELSLGRLEKANLLIFGTHLVHPHSPYLAIHPLLATTGGPYRRRWQWLQFIRHAHDPAAVEALADAFGVTRSPLAS